MIQNLQEKIHRIKMLNGQLCGVCAIPIESELQAPMFCSEDCAKTYGIEEQYIQLRIAKTT